MTIRRAFARAFQLEHEERHPLLKGQPPTSPKVFASRTTVAGAKRHLSAAASVVIEDRSAGSAASCHFFICGRE